MWGGHGRGHGREMTDLRGQMTGNVGQHDLAPRRRMQIRYRFTALVQFAALLLARHASRREEVPHGKQPVAVEESRHRPSGSRRRWPKCTPARLHAGILYVCTAQSARSLRAAAYSQMSGALKIRTRTYDSRLPYSNHVASQDLADCRSLTAIVQTCHVACKNVVFHPARSSDFRVALARQAFAGSWLLA